MTRFHAARRLLLSANDVNRLNLICDSICVANKKLNIFFGVNRLKFSSTHYVGNAFTLPYRLVTARRNIEIKTELTTNSFFCASMSYGNKSVWTSKVQTKEEKKNDKKKNLLNYNLRLSRAICYCLLDVGFYIHLSVAAQKCNDGNGNR